MKLADEIRYRRVIAEWDESKHPRVPSGSSEGGQFGSGGEAGIPSVAFSETTDYDAFRKAMFMGKRNENFTDHSDAEYAKGKVFLSADGKAGAAVSEDGDAINLFNNGDVKGAGKAAMVKQIELGAKTLDCYDGFLPKLYSKFGFVETGRLKFNDAYAPPGWDFGKLGRPDIVFMSWQGADRKAVAKNYGSQKYAMSTRYYDDFETAKEDSRRAAH